MNKPPLDELLRISSNRYILAIVAAKYARVLTEKVNAGLIDEQQKPVSQAFEDLTTGKVKCGPPKRGFKQAQ